MLTFFRKGSAEGDRSLVVCNFSGTIFRNFRIGVPRGGRWEEILNSDATIYGGSGQGNMGGLAPSPIGWNGQPQSLDLPLPPLSILSSRKFPTMSWPPTFGALSRRRWRLASASGLTGKRSVEVVLAGTDRPVLPLGKLPDGMLRRVDPRPRRRGRFTAIAWTAGAPSPTRPRGTSPRASTDRRRSSIQLRFAWTDAGLARGLARPTWSSTSCTSVRSRRRGHSRA